MHSFTANSESNVDAVIDDEGHSMQPTDGIEPLGGGYEGAGVTRLVPVLHQSYAYLGLSA